MILYTQSNNAFIPLMKIFTWMNKGASYRVWDLIPCTIIEYEQSETKNFMEYLNITIDDNGDV